MSKQQEQKKVQKAKPSLSRENVSDVPTEKKKRYFNRTLYIPGFGMVVAGEELTKEALDAWQAKTKVPISDFVGKSRPEKPKSDKEKLAEYEQLKKE